MKASEIIVHAAVSQGLWANSIPYFGFERRGAPVSAFVRLDVEPIRPKTQVYDPDCVVIMDYTLTTAVNVFEGVREGGVLVVNTKHALDSLQLPPILSKVGIVDATGISLRVLGRAVPNTVMLGAFARTTGWVDVELLAQRAAAVFGPKNRDALLAGYELTEVFGMEGGQRP